MSRCQAPDDGVSPQDPTADTVELGSMAAVVQGDG